MKFLATVIIAALIAPCLTSCVVTGSFEVPVQGGGTARVSSSWNIGDGKETKPIKNKQKKSSKKVNPTDV